LVFGPVAMRRIYLGVPIEYEDQVLSAIGEMGVVQLIKEPLTKHPMKSRISDLSSRTGKLDERLDAILAERSPEKMPEHAEEVLPQEFTCEDAENFLLQSETKLSELILDLQQLEKQVEEASLTREKVSFLAQNGLRTDEIGNFEHIFVKVGFIKSSLTSRLATYLAGTSTALVITAGRPRENLVILAGLNDDRQFSEESLKLLNFQEISLPPNLNADPKLALDQLEKQIETAQNEILRFKQEMRRLKSRSSRFGFCLSEAVRYEGAKQLVMRTKTRSLIHGWIPLDEVNNLKDRVEQIVPKPDIYFKTENPRLEDDVPVQFKSRGITRAFEMLTFVQGVPNYFEINPTPIYTLLYAIMFGMMFGDIGGGIALMAIGVIVTKFRRGVFAFSLNATKRLAQILIACGFTSIIFGYVYGVFFLLRTPFGGLLDPITSVEEIITIALVFGVAQIILSLFLNIINMIRRKEPLKALLGERGIIGLLFYTMGVVIGYRFVVEKSFSVFLQPDTVVFTFIALSSLVIIVLSPLIESYLRHEQASTLKKTLEGFGTGLEAFIAFIANSVSYIRLAAFAIAHEAIALAAVVLGTVLGNVLSLVLLNVLDFVVEGFAASIQSLRLMYYEFSTRFFLKTGVKYDPFKVGPNRIKA